MDRACQLLVSASGAGPAGDGAGSMARRAAQQPSADGELGVRARLCLFHGTSLSAERALSLPDAEITFELLLHNGATADNVLAAGLGPVHLKARGAATAEDLRKLGLDAVSLRDTSVAHQALLAYGAESVRRAFVISPQDAVAVAGSDAVHVLRIDAHELLAACAGAPAQAVCVLAQLPRGCSLQGVPATALLDAGLRRQALVALGYSISQIVSQCGATGTQLAKLGFML